jgi:two-component system chemotaxis response regulator CheY
MAGLVLVVDDDPSIRQIISEILLDEGYDVLTAPDGGEALARAQEHPPAVILLDYQMPVLDGARFVQAYRRLRDPLAPIILLTAAVSAQQRAVEVGADACLGKPFELDDLVRLVQRYAA